MCELCDLKTLHMKKSQNIRHEVSILPQLDKACGLDMHKDSIVCFISDKEGKEQQLKEFGTFTKDLQEIRDLLVKHGSPACLMESTGIYWLALYNILTESGIPVTVANPIHIKQIPKRKTDKKDARWLCTLLLNGLVRASFVPCKEQQKLRELNRNRLFYTQQESRVKNRIVKVLEGKNIKIRSVVSNISTKSSMQIITLLSQGISDIETLIACCHGKVKTKKDKMRFALEGTLDGHSQEIIKMYLEDIAHIQSQIRKLEENIHSIVSQHYAEVVQRIKKITGVGNYTAEVIISEIGENMDIFPTADHLTSWAGLAPGNNESAGKHRNTAVKKGNKYLRVALITVAWAAVRTKDSYWRALYLNLTKRIKMKRQKAIVAIARRLLKVAYNVIKGSKEYQEKGFQLFFELQIKNKQKLYQLAQNVRPS